MKLICELFLKEPPYSKVRVSKRLSGELTRLTLAVLASTFLLLTAAVCLGCLLNLSGEIVFAGF